MPRPWHCENNSARLTLARFSALIDVLAPAVGLRDCRIDQQPLENFSALGVDLAAVDLQAAPGAVEHYVREGDLIATYADRPQRQMRAQIYWRAAAHPLAGALAAVELVASVQTNLLDSCPRLAVNSHVTASQCWWLDDVASGTFVDLAGAPPERAAGRSHGADCFLFRLPDCGVSYVQMMLPDEGHLSEARLSPTGGASVQLTHRLFAERLEKGVILRARVLGVLVDREGDQAAALRHYAAFQSDELPLTT